MNPMRIAVSLAAIVFVGWMLLPKDASPAPEPKEEPAPVHVTINNVVQAPTPVPQPPPVVQQPRPVVAAPTPPPAPVEPDLKKIDILGRTSITNARIYQITATGMTFNADQGLTKVLWNELPAGFYAYYASRIPKATAPPTVPAKQTTTTKTQTTTTTTKTVATIPPPDPRAVRAQQRLRLQNEIAYLENQSRLNGYQSLRAGSKMNPDLSESIRLRLEKAKDELAALQEW